MSRAGTPSGTGPHRSGSVTPTRSRTRCQARCGVEPARRSVATSVSSRPMSGPCPDRRLPVVSPVPSWPARFALVRAPCPGTGDRPACRAGRRSTAAARFQQGQQWTKITEALIRTSRGIPPRTRPPGAAPRGSCPIRARSRPHTRAGSQAAVPVTHQGVVALKAVALTPQHPGVSRRSGGPRLRRRARAAGGPRRQGRWRPARSRWPHPCRPRHRGR